MAGKESNHTSAEQDYVANEIAQHLSDESGFIESTLDEENLLKEWLDIDPEAEDDFALDADLVKTLERLAEEGPADTDFSPDAEDLEDFAALEAAMLNAGADIDDLLGEQSGGEQANAVTPDTKDYSGLLSNISIGSRITMLIAIPLLVLAGLGGFSYYTLTENRAALKNIQQLSQQVEVDQHLMDDMSGQFQLTLQSVHLGSITLNEGVQRLRDFNDKLNNVYIPDLQTQAEIDRLPAIVDRAIGILEKGNRAELEIFLLNDLDTDIEDINMGLNADVMADMESVKMDIVDSENTTDTFLNYSLILTAIGALLSFILGYSIYRSISNPIKSLSTTLSKLSSGDLDARSALRGDNELTVLGTNFNQMVEQRNTTQNQITQENDQLNDSVFNLLEAVAELAERNLTVRAEVTEDATGPLADAINELADQTGTVLKQVRKIAASVEAASQMVNRSAISVNKLSLEEQSEAQATANQLEDIMGRLTTVANSAKQANELADTTSTSTRNTQETVSSTLDNMIEIRTNVQETGKRLKRLGERSQEISQIIDVINNLSERTTVLALNASMQAASAGDAGRGFSVIAEEIQRLSENSRESTDRISTLVSNIQQEANATITNMDATIEQVLDGSTLAEDAAQQMQATLEATTRLVDSVDQIARSSAEQADISKELRVRADSILESTQSTGKELITLTDLTRKMAGYGKQLVKSVNVFKLEA